MLDDRGREDRQAREQIRQQRLRLLGLDDQGAGVGRLDLGEIAGDVGEGIGNLGLVLQRAAEGEDHILCAEGLAIGELDALAQLEGPAVLAVILPGGGEAGLERLLLVLAHETVEDVLGQCVVGGEVVIMRVDRGRLGGQRDAQRLRHGGRAEHAGAEQKGDECALTHRSVSVPVADGFDSFIFTR